MTIRATTIGDGIIATEWAVSHGREPAEAMRFPAIGVVAEDDAGPVAMAWAYCVPECGLAYVENFVTRPGIALKDSVEAGACVMGGLVAAVKSLGFSALVAYSLPACARYLAGFGWEVADERMKIAMSFKIP
jgi:hypothetical protein